MMGRAHLGDTASHVVAGSQTDRNESQSIALSPKVNRMMTMLASRQEAVVTIRIRAAEVGQ
jgi:hypothetical protein